MRRTQQEFKAEILRRSEAYRQNRRKRRRKLAGGLLCFVLVLSGLYQIRPFFAMGGSSAPMENAAAEAPMEGAAYGSTMAPAAMEPQAYADDSKTVTDSWDLIPMVMIDGELYLDTGFYSEDTRKCGTYDGEITSQVAGNRMPTEDDQSNFGVGYGYQYGEEGTVEIHMDEKWWIFATEKVHREMHADK